MKVHYDNFIFYLQKAGGISKVWFNLINILQAKPKLSFSFTESSTTKNIFRKKLDISHDKILFEPNKLSFFKRFSRIKNQNYQIYHSSYFRPIKDKKDTKVVVTIHDFIYEKYSNPLPTMLHVFLKKRALKQADAVICVSESTKKDFVKFYPSFDKNHIYVVPNGVDKCFKPLKKIHKSTVKNFKVKNNSFLLYVGNRGFCKNFEFVLRLMNNSEVINRKFNLVCVGGGNFTRAELKKINSMGISNKIHHFNYVSSKELDSLYNNAYCLLFPSIYEGFGIPVVEAMKSGCPIWCSNSSSIIELLSKEYPLHFNPLDFEEAITCFLKLLDNKTRNNVINFGLERSKYFSWDKCANQTLEIYTKLLSK